MASFKKNYLLLIRGIKLSDLTDDEMFDTKYTEGLSTASPEFSTNYVIPKRFTTAEEWPKRSKLKCWECCRMFHCAPACLAHSPVEVSYGCVAYNTVGNFCGWGCAVRYGKINFTNNFSRIEECTLYVYRALTGLKVFRITEAPSRTIMSEYCGDEGVSLTEFEVMLKGLKNEESPRFEGF